MYTHMHLLLGAGGCLAILILVGNCYYPGNTASKCKQGKAVYRDVLASFGNCALYFFSFMCLSDLYLLLLKFFFFFFMCFTLVTEVSC